MGHSFHQGAFNDVQALRCFLSSGLGIFHDELVDSLNQGMAQSLPNRLLTPGQVLALVGAALVVDGLGMLQ